ncbi:MAG TPA: hypothetical protein ENG33_04615, partial [Chloroflexi bacterium]|nr:hypothetical protein [Chloroflexota bacterium]
MRCPVCGSEIEGKPKRCPQCGNLLPPKKERRCPRCGVRVAEHAKECFMCGTPLDKKPSFLLSIPWADIMLLILLLSLVGLWFFSPFNLPKVST